MEIKPTYVDFNTAKLLKSKGFNLKTNCYYYEDGQFREYYIEDFVGMDYGSKYVVEIEEFFHNWNDDYVTKKDGSRCFGCGKNKGYFETFSAPEQHVVVEWLRINHGIWICINPAITEKKTKYYFYSISKEDNLDASDWQKLSGEVMQACYQDVEGNFINYDLYEIKVFEMGFGFKTPQECYSAAFDYVLNNLI